MKKVIFLIVFLTISIYAKSCNLQDLTTLDKVEKAQKCMISQLKELDDYFVRYKKYHESIKDTLTLLRSQGGNCRKWQQLYKYTQDDDYKISLADCERLFKRRAIQYNKVSKQYNRISIYYEKLKLKVKGLELKRETLEQTSDLLGKK